jgi:hypothetical protein
LPLSRSGDTTPIVVPEGRKVTLLSGATARLHRILATIFTNCDKRLRISFYFDAANL